MRHPDERPDGGPPLGTGGHPDEGKIHAWLDGELSDAEGAAVEQHAVACAACREAIAEARGLIAASSRIVAALDAVPAGVLPERAPVTHPLFAAGTAAAARPDRQSARAQRSRPAVRRWTGRVGALAALALVAVGATIVVDQAGGPQRVAEMLSLEESAPSARVSADAARDGASDRAAAESQRTPAGDVGVPDVSDVPAPPRGVARAPAGATGLSAQAAEKVEESAATVVAGPQSAVEQSALPEPVPVPVPPPLPFAATTAPLPAAATSDAVGRVARQESRAAPLRGAAAAPAPAAPPMPAPPPPAGSSPAILGGAAVRSAFAPTPTLSGQVLDLASGTSIAGAIVSVEGAESTAITDGEGRFVLQRIPAGRQTALVRRVGFQSARVPVDVPDSAGVAGQVIVRLRPAEASAEELVVTDVPVDPRRESTPALRARQYAGCYRLEVTGRSGPARDAVERALPGWVSLTLEPTEPPQWFRVESRVTGSGRRGYWRSSDRQRIEFIWVSPQGELRLRLGGSSTASELTGRATWAQGAAERAAGGSDVRARRTGCDLPPG